MNKISSSLNLELTILESVGVDGGGNGSFILTGFFLKDILTTSSPKMWYYSLIFFVLICKELGTEEIFVQISKMGI